jgi:enoyl-CoA hydratase
MPWDPMKDYRGMKANTDDFFTLWRSYKPVICKVHGYAVAGGSDIALCADIVIMAEDAKIGYMPARVWGCPTTAMWVYRLGAEKAKRMLLTGDTRGWQDRHEKMASSIQAVRANDLDPNGRCARQGALAVGYAEEPVMMQKLMINLDLQKKMGLGARRMMASLFVGISRLSPEGIWFKKLRTLQARLSMHAVAVARQR